MTTLLRILLFVTGGGRERQLGELGRFLNRSTWAKATETVAKRTSRIRQLLDKREPYCTREFDGHPQLLTAIPEGDSQRT